MPVRRQVGLVGHGRQRRAYCTLADAARAAPAAEVRIEEDRLSSGPPAGRDPPIHSPHPPHCAEPSGARGRLRSHRTGGRSPTPTRRPHANGRTHYTSSPPPRRRAPRPDATPPTPPSRSYISRLAAARRELAGRSASSATRPRSPATSARLPHVHPLALARSAGSIDLIGGAEVAGPDPRSRALGRGKVDQRRGSDLCLRSRGAGT